MRRVRPPPPSTPISLLITTLTETIFSLSTPLISSPSLPPHVFNISLALCPFPLAAVVLPNRQPFISSLSHLTTPLPQPSLSTYCRALMSTLARSVNYSITGRRIPPPPLPFSKNRFMLGVNHNYEKLRSSLFHPDAELSSGFDSML